MGTHSEGLVKAGIIAGLTAITAGLIAFAYLAATEYAPPAQGAVPQNHCEDILFNEDPEGEWLCPTHTPVPQPTATRVPCTPPFLQNQTPDPNLTPDPETEYHNCIRHTPTTAPTATTYPTSTPLTDCHYRSDGHAQPNRHANTQADQAETGPAP